MQEYYIKFGALLKIYMDGKYLLSFPVIKSVKKLFPHNQRHITRQLASVKRYKARHNFEGRQPVICIFIETVEGIYLSIMCNRYNTITRSKCAISTVPINLYKAKLFFATAAPHFLTAFPNLLR